MEFHIAKTIRQRVELDELLFSFSGSVLFANVAASRKLAHRLNLIQGPAAPSEKTIHAGALYAMGLIDELSHALIAKYRENVDPSVFAEALRYFGEQVGPEQRDRLLLEFAEQFPTVAVFRGELTAEEWLAGETDGISNREAAFEEMLMLWLANNNPAFAPFGLLFEDQPLKQETVYEPVTTSLPAYFKKRPEVESGLGTLLDALRAPMLAAPDSLTGALNLFERRAEAGDEGVGQVADEADGIRQQDLAA